MVDHPPAESVRLNQCAACPWKVSTVPGRDIPGGYCPAKHAGLRGTIAAPGAASLLRGGPLRAMACHESPPGREQACVGWLAHQLGPGNNLGLRMLARDGRYRHIVLDGPQHERFEDTLPKRRRRGKAAT